MSKPYLFYDELVDASAEGGYIEKPKLTQISSVFLLSTCVAIRQRQFWQDPDDPIDDSEWRNILDLIRDAEGELMMSFGIGTIIPSVADLDTESSLLRMDGQTVAQDDYPDLASVVPATWLSGDDIVLPDMDAISLHGNYGSVGSIVGANTITLDTSQIPSHNHTQNPHSHAYTQNIGTPTGAGPIVAGASIVVPTPSVTGIATPTNNPTGGDGSHDNIPESMSLIYYIVAR